MTIDPEELANAQARARMLEHVASVETGETAVVEIPANAQEDEVEEKFEEKSADNETKFTEGE